MEMTPTAVLRLAERFALDAPPADARPLGQGLINLTFQVRTARRDYVLQRLNPTVFTDPAPVMANLRLLTELAIPARSADLRLPRLIPAVDGQDWIRDAQGHAWRMLDFIPDTINLTTIQIAEQAEAVGAALGAFHGLTARIETGRFATTVPRFHETPDYLMRWDQALADAGTAARHPAVQSARRFIDTRRALATVLTDARDTGALPVRTVHGDPKLDNLLFDPGGRQVRAIVDLDTVQPGLLLYDLGDCLRSCCRRGSVSSSASATPEPLSGVQFDLRIGRGILTGYCRTAGMLLNDTEAALLETAIRTLPFELGLRFLTDHLDGDRYFRVRAPGQNLDKALTQFALVACLERQASAVGRMIDDCFASARPEFGNIA